MSHPYEPQTDGSDRPFPAAVQTEVTVLGAMMLDAVAINDALARLRPEDFLLNSHQRIYRHIMGMVEKGYAVDMVTVIQSLRDGGELDAVGGQAYVADTCFGVPRNANIENYVRILKDKSLARQGISVCTEGAALFSDGTESSLDTLNTVEQRLMELTEAGQERDLKKTSEVIRGSFVSVEGLYEQGRDITGLATGFVEFDRMTCGLQKGDLVILAARPSMGKTALAINIAENAGVSHGKTVAIFSMEMAEGQLVQRMMASQANVGGRKLQRGFLGRDDRQPLQKALEALNEAGIYIDDTPSITVAEMRAKARRLRHRTGALDLIVVDYLQLMAGGRRTENRTQEVSAISRGLKVLAKELQVPVLALSQLSRASETRGGDKKPILSDLRESGSIEQDADVVAFIHREEYYDRDNEDVKGKAEIIVAKQRNGPVGVVHLAYVADITRFANLAAEYPY